MFVDDVSNEYQLDCAGARTRFYNFANEGTPGWIHSQTSLFQSSRLAHATIPSTARGLPPGIGSVREPNERVPESRSERSTRDGADIDSARVYSSGRLRRSIPDARTDIAIQAAA